MERKTLSILFTTIAAILLLLVVGCDFQESEVLDGVGPDIGAPNPMRLTINFDEKYAKYALHWPSGIIHDNSMGKAADEDMLFLVDYQYTSKTIQIDEEGYFHWSKENIKGDQSVRLPEEIWDELKDIKPVRRPLVKPSNRVVLSPGLLASYNEDGEEIYSSVMLII